MSTPQSDLRQQQSQLGKNNNPAGQGSFLEELLQIQEEERLRIARELHDGIGQMLALLRSKLDMLSHLPQNAPPMQQSWSEAAEHVRHILDEVRRITLELMPAVLEDLGLDAAIRTLAHDCLSHQIRVLIDIPPLNDIVPTAQHIHLYRILQESFSNILRHSQASEVTVRVCLTNKGIECEITDNGIGFPAHPARADVTASHYGLRNMRARAKLLGGSIRIESKPRQGTTVRIVLPLGENCDRVRIGSGARMLNKPMIT